jgi:hypothetical protein
MEKKGSAVVQFASTWDVATPPSEPYDVLDGLNFWRMTMKRTIPMITNTAVMVVWFNGDIKKSRDTD